MTDKQETAGVVQWHPPFCAAMELDLMEDAAAFRYYREYNLGFKPNMIDFLVVKADPAAEIHSSLAQFFKKCNLVEYKSPDDRLNMKIVYRSIGYLYLYLCYGKDADDPDAMTLTFVRNTKPQKLFAELQERDFHVVCFADGIYHVTKRNCANMQIVVTSELDRRKYRWLTKLSKHLSVEEMMDAVQAQANLDEEHWIKADAVMHLIKQVNAGVVKEADQMTFDEIRVYFREEALKQKAELEKYQEQMEEQKEQMAAQQEQMEEQKEQMAAQREETATARHEAETIKKKNDELERVVQQKDVIIERLTEELKQLRSKTAML